MRLLIYHGFYIFMIDIVFILTYCYVYFDSFWLHVWMHVLYGLIYFNTHMDMVLMLVYGLMIWYLTFYDGFMDIHLLTYGCMLLIWITFYMHILWWMDTKYMLCDLYVYTWITCYDGTHTHLYICYTGNEKCMLNIHGMNLMIDENIIWDNKKHNKW